MKRAFLCFVLVICAFCAFSQSEKVDFDKDIGKMGMKMVEIPVKNIKVLNTEVTQEFYKSVIGSNPSFWIGDKNPVEKVSWFDAIYFCNKLSQKYSLAPVYSYDGSTDVSKWNYTPHVKGSMDVRKLSVDVNANGFRLLTDKEWNFAAKGGIGFVYSGSYNIDEVAWYKGNSSFKPNVVAGKKANGYGLYDMSGNVWEWIWDSYGGREYRFFRGGSYKSAESMCAIEGMKSLNSYNFGEVNSRYDYVGFRIACGAQK